VVDAALFGRYLVADSVYRACFMQYHAGIVGNHGVLRFNHLYRFSYPLASGKMDSNQSAGE
jgi:hypothetical protein